MTGLGDITGFFSRWIDAAAAAIVAALSSFGKRKTVQVIEEDAGSFVIQTARDTPSGLPFERAQIIDGKLAGSHPDAIAAMLDGARAELVLRPARVLFRPLELPQRATEFLGGVVRAQIDRLTPWNANDAAFGWSEPLIAGTDRMTVTVAATARALVQPLADALIAAGAETVTVMATPPGAAPITVLDHHAPGAFDFNRVRGALVGVLIAAGLLAGVSLSAALRSASDATARRPQRRCARWNAANTRARRVWSCWKCSRRSCPITPTSPSCASKATSCA